MSGPVVPSLFFKNRRVVAGDGTPIAYAELGHGPRIPVVLANGWSCPDVYWAELVPYLVERGHRVVVVDTRGHGDSGLPRRPGRFNWARRGHNLRPEDLSLERIALDLIDVCDDADITQAAFIGHSMGVQTILEVYRAAPQRVDALVAVAGPYENPLKTFAGTSSFDTLFPVAQYALMAMPRLLLPAYQFLLNRHQLGHWTALRLRAAGPKLTLERFAPHLTHLAGRDPVVLFKLLESMRDHSAADVLPTISVPFLILAAGRDYFCPPRSQRRMHELAPGSEIVWFSDARHMLPLEEADAVNAAIGPFLDRAEGLVSADGQRAAQ